MDDIDYNSLHCYIMDDNKVVAYLRAFSQDDNKYIVRVGRVLTLVHGNGLGKELMQKSIVAITSFLFFIFFFFLRLRQLFPSAVFPI